MPGRTVDSKKDAQVSGNTDKEGGGTEYRLVCDGNGYLQIEVVGGSGSYPYNPETDDDSIPAGEVRETPNVLLHGYDEDDGDWQRVLTDGSGKIQTTATVISPGAYNAENDDDSVPATESHESNIVLLHGYDPIGTDWERIHTDSSHGLLVANTNFGTMNTSLNEIESAIENIEEACASINTDWLLIGDAGSVINLDAAGDVQVDVLSSALPTGAATEATLSTIDTSLNEIESAIENIEEACASIGTDYLLIGDAGSIINLDAAGDVQVDVLTVPDPLSDSVTPADNLANPTTILEVAGYLLGWDNSGSVWERVRTDGSGALKVYTP